MGTVSTVLDGEPTGQLPLSRDRARRSRRHASSVEVLLRLQNEILEAVAGGEPLTEIAALLCRRVEAMVPGLIATVLTVDREGRLRSLAAPSLPISYSSAIDGLPIGPSAGSCGTAAFRREEVVVDDIATDPLWEGFREFALPYGLAACWSTPVIGRCGDVLGTFAFYFQRRLGADDGLREIVRACNHLCAIAMEHEAVRSRNHHLAYFDTLTGLPNRTRFSERLRETLALSPLSVGLLLFDIDHFRTINDTLGHDVGDAVLSELSRRLADADLPDFVCRIGGDEFAVIVEDCTSGQALWAAARRILRVVDPPIVLDGRTLPLRVTIGGVLAGEDGLHADELVQNADLALDHAKKIRRGGYRRYKPDLRVASTVRTRAVGAVDSALREDRIFACYQPIVHLSTGVVLKFEALARMRAPDGSMISAREFSPAFADAKIAHDITTRMLTVVAHDLAVWSEAHLDPPPVAINLSTGDFLRGDIEARLTRIFAKAGVPLDRLMLEVTESAMMDNEDNSVADAVAALRRRGMQVALDDFGTGFASLTHLISFPVDVIKVDKSFIDRVLVDPPSAVVVEALISIAGRLKMRLIAEGIETRPQVERLKSLGCVLGQGYLYSKPMPASAVRRFLASNAERAFRPMH